MLERDIAMERDQLIASHRDISCQVKIWTMNVNGLTDQLSLILEISEIENIESLKYWKFQKLEIT